MIKAAISCPLSVLNTVRKIIMRYTFRDNVWCIKNIAAVVFIFNELFPLMVSCGILCPHYNIGTS